MSIDDDANEWIGSIPEYQLNSHEKEGVAIMMALRLELAHLRSSLSAAEKALTAAESRGREEGLREAAGKLFVTRMLRWGSRDGHSYVLGVYTSLDVAKQEGEKERDYRAGKYLPVITIHSLNNILTAGEDGFWINDDEAGEGKVVAEQTDMCGDEWTLHDAILSRIPSPSTMEKEGKSLCLYGDEKECKKECPACKFGGDSGMM